MLSTRSSPEGSKVSGDHNGDGKDGLREKKQTDPSQPEQLFKPNFDGSFRARGENDEAGMLFPPNVPFLCGPMPMTESNLTSWLVRGTERSQSFEQEDSRSVCKRETLEDNSCDAAPHRKTMKKCEERRKEMRNLAALVETGGARVDEYGRLVATRPDWGANNNNNAGAGAVGVGVAGNDNADVGGVNNRGDQQQPPLDPLAIPQPQQQINNNIGPVPFGVGNDEDEEEEERRATEREEREAADAVARAVRRYRRDGVPEDEFELIEVPTNENDAVNLTFRRICFAVLAVVTAFVCIMLQTLPLFDTNTTPNPIFDKLLYEILHVRDLGTHLRNCDGLGRYDRGWMQSIGELWQWRSRKINCADGVLHIPAVSVVSDRFYAGQHSSGMEPKQYEPFVHGFNATWYLPCKVPSIADDSFALPCYPGFQSKWVEPDFPVANVCPARDSREEDLGHERCFRGVHDGIVTLDEVVSLLELASDLIAKGGDHVEIHRNVLPLLERVPSVPRKLEHLLRNHYRTAPVHPVAFRISVALPMMDNSIRALLYYPAKASLLVSAINRTTYAQWDESIRQMNELASFSLPPPFGSKPFRDPCVLLSDLEASDDFVFHTSVFLANGAGEDFTGGAALYVDNHRSNSNPRRKIRRGLSVDGSRGRVIVSTGGEENRRCRLPTRSGVRAVLQVW